MVVASIFGMGILSLAAAVYFWFRVQAVQVMEGAANAAEGKRLEDIAAAIREGAHAFLTREYRVLLVFILGFAALIAVLINDPGTPIREGIYTGCAFMAGCFISVLAGFIGMTTATQGNVRTTVSSQKSLGKGFATAVQAGAVMGFGLAGLAVLGLIICYLVLRWILPHYPAAEIMELVSGFGLGGSSVALFGRVGGGIYTKAADVGADLVGKVEAGIPEDDPRNPAAIADNVGDNVGDIAGMGADLFGSVAESTCAALVIGAVAFGNNNGALLYPILLSGVGILCSLVGVFVARAETPNQVEAALKKTLIVSTVLMAISTYFLTVKILPASFQLHGRTLSATGVWFALMGGLVSGLMIGLVTEFFTSHRYKPVRQVAGASETGTATNIIYGLALGYQSSVVPLILIALTFVIGVHFAGMYGIAISSIGMLGTIAVGLTIDAYGPVADNAGGIAEMAHMAPEVRQRTDALDSAGNTTAAVGKGFAIGSAALTGLALFSAFITRCQELRPDLHILTSINLLDPGVMAGLMVGGALAAGFSAMTMRSVGSAALDMINEVRRQFREIPGLLEGTARADYARCVDIATRASLREMLAPGLLVMGTPLVVGWVFGPRTLAGMLIGALVVAVTMAVSMANSGGAWDNAKKYIETGELGGRGTETHKASVVGDTVGDPFKDTSGPALNILVKLMAILSLVFAPFLVH